MLIDTQKVSPWYVLHRGFRLTKDCRNCGTENSHYKAYDKISSGILSRCDSCGKEILRMKAVSRAGILASSPRHGGDSAEAY